MKIKKEVFVYEVTVKTIPGRTEIVLLPAIGKPPTVEDLMEALKYPYLCTYHMRMNATDLGCLGDGGMLKVANIPIPDKATIHLIRRDLLEEEKKG